MNILSLEDHPYANSVYVNTAISAAASILLIVTIFVKMPFKTRRILIFSWFFLNIIGIVLLACASIYLFVVGSITIHEQIIGHGMGDIFTGLGCLFFGKFI